MSVPMAVYDDYVAGWLDSSIHHFLEMLSPNDESTKYALISCIDSNEDIAALRKSSPELRASKSVVSKARVLGKGLLLPTERLREANARSRIFFGFDEVWFFPSDRIEAKPDSACLVGPSRLTPAALRKFGEWMRNCACSLALGDGEGLNFIVRAQGLPRCLLGHSLGQPEPVVTPYETETTGST